MEPRPSIGDFDGDGTPDTLDRQYYHMTPIERPSSSALLTITSGATGEALAVKAIPTVLSRTEWTGDLDGNGTDDVLVEYYRERKLHAYGWR